jgi:hypothetical protein
MAISQGDVPEAACKHVPRYPLVSCTLIGRLAIAKDQQGQRLGSVLLADALLRAFESANTVGSSMVVVDALDEVAAGLHGAWLCATTRFVTPHYADEPSRRGNWTVMSIPSLKKLGKHSGKQFQDAVAIWRSTHTHGELSDAFAPSLGAAGREIFEARHMPKLAVRPLQIASCCFPGFAERDGEAKNGPRGPF